MKRHIIRNKEEPRKRQRVIKTSINDLPVEILYQISEYLPSKSVCILSLTCINLMILQNNDTFWVKKYVEELKPKFKYIDLSDYNLNNKTSFENWFQIYKKISSIKYNAYELINYAAKGFIEAFARSKHIYESYFPETSNLSYWPISSARKFSTDHHRIIIFLVNEYSCSDIIEYIVVPNKLETVKNLIKEKTLIKYNNHPFDLLFECSVKYNNYEMTKLLFESKVVDFSKYFTYPFNREKLSNEIIKLLDKL